MMLCALHDRDKTNACKFLCIPTSVVVYCTNLCIANKLGCKSAVSDMMLSGCDAVKCLAIDGLLYSTVVVPFRILSWPFVLLCNP